VLPEPEPPQATSVPATAPVIANFIAADKELRFIFLLHSQAHLGYFSHTLFWEYIPIFLPCPVLSRKFQPEMSESNAMTSSVGSLLIWICELSS
jgi:hypothetical protein